MAGNIIKLALAYPKLWRNHQMTKIRIKKFLSSLFVFCLLFASLTGCKQQSPETKLTQEQKMEILEKAYVYTLPLMIMDATYTVSTNTVKATYEQAPPNQLFHAQNIATAEFKNVVTPNVDTIYSQIFLDLTEDAVILELPKTDRFCAVEVMDAYSNSIQIEDCTRFENESEKYIFTYMDFDGEIPKGMTEIECPTTMMWVLIRTICNNAEDAANVHKIQEKMDSYTLEQFKDGTMDVKPEGIYDEANQFVPSNKVLSMTMEEYFARANELMEKNSPAKEDTVIVEEMAKIGVGAGFDFDSSVFGEDVSEIWKNMVSNNVKLTTENSMKFIQTNGSWTYFGAPIAEFGTEYYYRAFISLVGFGANPVSVAVYPKTSQDSEGNRLNGRNEYILHFDKEQIPTVLEHGFWSVTAYNSEDNLLIDNEIDRYCINDRSDLKYNEDGSLDVVVSCKRPEGDVSNWLPVCEGDFHFVLRVYFPTENILENEWSAPTIVKQ